MEHTVYRRPLPAEAIAFSSPEGRRLFGEALAAGGLEGYFPLAEQFHTQSDPAYCGLGSLVVALNALAIDPGRLWKGPWRWFGEELLDCCVPLEEVRRRGLALDELACLARCNGAEVDVVHADSTKLAAWRAALVTASRGDAVLIASYDRSSLGQTGSGHFSPIGGYHAGRDLALVLDVARFKYPPHWVSAARLGEAMMPIDPAAGRPRGFMLLRPRAHGIALGFSVKCDGESWQGLARRLMSVAELGPAADVAALARAVVPLLAHVELRVPTAGAHQEALANARAALRETRLYAEVESVAGAQHAEAASVLLLASAELLLPEQRARVDALAGALPEDSPLGAELTNLRAQLAALRLHARLVSPSRV
jgi:glutathione gamma-glutamylcysteinyltransferase